MAIRSTGDIIAENYIISSSVTYMTQSFASGSTTFGNTGDDVHQFTGSLRISSSAAVSAIEISKAANGNSIGITHIGSQNVISIDNNSGGGNSAIYVENTGATGYGLLVTSDQGSGQGDPLVGITADNTGFDTPALKIQQDGAGHGINIDQNGNSSAIYIDTEATTHGIFIDSPATTSGQVIFIDDANSITTGGALQVQCASSALATTAAAGLVRIIYTGTSTAASNILFVKNDNASAVNTTGIYVQQDSTGPGIEVVASGYAISGSATSTGSFGQVAVDKVYFGNRSWIEDAGPVMRFQVGTNYNGFEFGEPDTLQPFFTIKGSGTAGGGHLSGSATTTGSFGSVYTAANVGIGTTAPSALLDVEGAGNTEAHFMSGTSTGNFDMRFGDTANRWAIAYSGASGTKSLGFYENGSSSHVMTLSGSRVGIRTTNPGHTLEVTSSAVQSGDYMASFINTYGGDGPGSSVLELQGGANEADGFILHAKKKDSGDPVLVATGAGKVGIGTTSPDTKLTIAEARQGSAADTILNQSILHIDDTTAWGDLHSSKPSGGSINFSGVYNSSDAQVIFGGIRGIKENNTDGNYDAGLVFATIANGGNLTEKMRIDSTGRIGIGTNDPEEVLDIQSSATNMAVRLMNKNADATPARLNFAKDGGSPADDDIVGQLEFYGKDSGDGWAQFGEIRVESTDVTDGNEDGKMVFQTQVAGVATDNITIKSGSVGIGTSTPAAAGMLHVVGTAKSRIAYFWNDGNHADYAGINIRAGADNASGTTVYVEGDDGDGQGVGTISNVSGTFQLIDGSDYRLKNNIRDTAITGSDIINSIKVRDFEWKKSGIGVTAGLVAQELTSSFAQAVSSGSADKVLGYSVLGVSRDRLVPVLVKALQESMARIETLETQMVQVSGSS